MVSSVREGFPDSKRFLDTTSGFAVYRNSFVNKSTALESMKVECIRIYALIA